jgi:hypothetical protein
LFNITNDTELFGIVSALKASLIENLDFLIEIQTDITDFINKIQYQLDVYKKAQRLKEVKDHGTLHYKTNFREVVSNINTLKYNGHKTPKTKIPIDFLYSDDGHVLCKRIAEKYKIPILIFTLEMSRQQIMYRFLSSESLINTNRLKTGKMTFTELIKLKESMIKLSNLSIFIDDNSNLTINDIRSKLKKIFIDSDKTGLVIIDYLQLMKLSFKLENRVQEISYLTRNLKLLAKEFNIPIILLSQLSRNVESRVNKRPMLSDLRESGCIVNSMFKNKNIFKLSFWLENLQKTIYAP